MSLVSGIAIYFIIWWVTLFIVLPIGVKTQAEAGAEDQHLGTVSSAPAKAHMLYRVVITTIASSLIFALYYWAVVIQGYGLDDLTFLPMPESLR